MKRLVIVFLLLAFLLTSVLLSSCVTEKTESKEEADDNKTESMESDRGEVSVPQNNSDADRQLTAEEFYSFFASRGYNTSYMYNGTDDPQITGVEVKSDNTEINFKIYETEAKAIEKFESSVNSLSEEGSVIEQSDSFVCIYRQDGNDDFRYIIVAKRDNTYFDWLLVNTPYVEVRPLLVELGYCE
jgi:hypothetical protein